MEKDKNLPTNPTNPIEPLATDRFPIITDMDHINGVAPKNLDLWRNFVNDSKPKGPRTPD